MSYEQYPQDANAYGFVVDIEELGDPYVKRCRVIAESDKAAEFTAMIHLTWDLLSQGVDVAWLGSR